jgi:hypothetical protein
MSSFESLKDHKQTDDVIKWPKSERNIENQVPWAKKRWEIVQAAAALSQGLGGPGLRAKNPAIHLGEAR